MPLTINTNSSATNASLQLSASNAAMRRSLGRLSSGNRIVSAADDAGGFAVAYKLRSRLTRVERVAENLQNSISFLQVQSSALQVAGNVITRMSELKTMSMDITKNSGDIENYNKEFIELQRQLGQMSKDKFNGISLFTHPSVQDHALQAISNENGKTSEVVSLARNFLAGEYIAASGAVLGGKEVALIKSLGQAESLNLPDLDGSADERTYTISLSSTEGILRLWQSTGGASDTFRVYHGSELIHDKTYGASTITMNDGRVLTPEPGSSTNWPVRVNEDEITFGSSGNQSKLLRIVANESGQSNGIPSSWKVFAEINYLRATSASTSTEFEDLDKFTMNDFTNFTQNLATALAQNGAEHQRLNMEIEGLRINQVNLETAHGRIMDADIALESTRFARRNVLVQSSAAMVAQANQLTNLALNILPT